MMPNEDPALLSARELFVITFKIESPNAPVLPQGQNPVLHVPTFVADIEIAAQKAKLYMADFQSTEEGKKLPGAKLSVEQIIRGGTILT